MTGYRLSTVPGHGYSTEYLKWIKEGHRMDVYVITDHDREPVAVAESPEAALAWVNEESDGDPFTISPYGEAWLIHYRDMYDDYAYAVNRFQVKEKEIKS